MKSVVIPGFATALGLAVPYSAAAQDCESLAGLNLPHTTIVTAESHPGGLFFPPNQAQPPKELIEFCRVAGVLTPSSDSSIGFEVWMPSLAWNGNFMAVGNGGLAGEIVYTAGATTDMGTLLNRGYATAGTDTGHLGSFIDGSWAIGHPEKVIDNAYRAVHETTVAAKEIIAAFYGTGPGYSYFNGCSTGGRQALIEAQRYPEDYDGIIAGAPAHDFTHLVAAGVSLSQATLSDPASYIPSSKLPALSSAVLAACDGLDGLVDGLLDDPRKCDFDPYSLLCTGAEDDSCLTEAQAVALEIIYKGIRNPVTHEKIYPGLEPGGELTGFVGWDASVTGRAPGAALDVLLSTGFMTGVVYEDASYDVQTFDFNDDMAFMDAKLAHLYNAVDPDLSAFRARGGKLLLFHGWSDAVIPPRSTIDYYKALKKEAGSMEQTQRFARLFMAPGMHHCIGGTGPFAFDAVSAIERWREDDAAPDQLIAAHVNLTNGQVDRTRPLCAYPLVAQYNGSGSIDNFTSFVCAEPPQECGDSDCGQ